MPRHKEFDQEKDDKEEILNTKGVVYESEYKQISSAAKGKGAVAIGSAEDKVDVDEVQV